MSDGKNNLMLFFIGLGGLALTCLLSSFFIYTAIHAACSIFRGFAELLYLDFRFVDVLILTSGIIISVYLIRSLFAAAVNTDKHEKYIRRSQE